MDVFNSGDQLIGEKKDRLQRKFTVAEVEKVFQAGSKEVENHSIVVTFSPKPTHEWDSNTSSKRLVDTSFIFELRVLGLDALKLDGNLFTGDDVGA